MLPKEINLLNEIITRKNGGAKGGNVHRAHIAHYTHIRNMKKKNLSMNIDID